MMFTKPVVVLRLVLFDVWYAFEFLLLLLFFFVCVCVNLWHSSLTTNLHACCLDPRSIKMFVLDEADEMLSRGFKDQIYDIFRKLPTSVQVW